MKISVRKSRKGLILNNRVDYSYRVYFKNTIIAKRAKRLSQKLISKFIKKNL